MADAPKKNDNLIYTSSVGKFKADSYKESTDGKGKTVASAILILTGTGKEKVVKGHNDNVRVLNDAVKAGGEIIVWGVILGGKENTYLAIHGTGPKQLIGIVSNVRHNFDSYEKNGKNAFVDAFVVAEAGDKKFGTPFKAFGNDALALKGVRNGDRINVPARQSNEERKPQDGDSKWVGIYLTVGAGTFTPASKNSDSNSPKSDS